MRIDGPTPVGNASPFGRIAPTMPTRVARAYGVEGPAPEPQAAARNENVDRLIAGVTPGGIDFDTPQPQPSLERLTLYRHPADQNAAATGVSVGRVLDVSG